MAIAIIIICGLFFDQFTKFLVFKNLTLNQSIPVINNIFHLTLVFNKGAAFGIFKNYTFLFIGASLLIIIFIGFSFKKRYHALKINLLNLSMALILSGAIGNLIDRVRFGYVIDFLDFRIWPVFNIADSLITIGAILLAYSVLKKQKS